jgi:thioredoxin-related protein
MQIPSQLAQEKAMASDTPSDPKKTKLDTAANIAIIVVCAMAAVALSLTIRDRMFPQRAPGAPPQVEKGERFDQLKNVVPAGSERALVVAVSPQCHFCNDSLPFYKQLIEQRNQKNSPVKFVAAVPAEQLKAEESQKFAGAGVQVDNMVNIDFASIKVPGTPTLMLVDKQGKVLDVWVGKLDEGGQKEVLERL